MMIRMISTRESKIKKNIFKGLFTQVCNAPGQSGLIVPADVSLAASVLTGKQEFPTRKILLTTMRGQVVALHSRVKCSPVQFHEGSL